MSMKSIWEACGGAVLPSALLALLTLVEIAPIKINPWSAIIKFIGSRLNADVTARLDTMQECQTETREKLNKHIQTDDERNANSLRTQILRFNDELVDDLHRPHTKEHFDEILSIIDDYEDYCKTHENYKNNKCVHAIANINRVYDERLAKHDFL